MIKNEWDRIDGSNLSQTAELDGLEVHVTFGISKVTHYGELRIWPVVPDDATQVDLPDELREYAGKKARIGNVWGGEIGLPWIQGVSLTQQLESLYAMFEPDKAAEIVEHAKLKGEEDEEDEEDEE